MRNDFLRFRENKRAAVTEKLKFMAQKNFWVKINFADNCNCAIWICFDPLFAAFALPRHVIHSGGERLSAVRCTNMIRHWPRDFSWFMIFVIIENLRTGSQKSRMQRRKSLIEPQVSLNGVSRPARVVSLCYETSRLRQSLCRDFSCKINNFLLVFSKNTTGTFDRRRVHSEGFEKRQISCCVTNLCEETILFTTFPVLFRRKIQSILNCKMLNCLWCFSQFLPSVGQEENSPFSRKLRVTLFSAVREPWMKISNEKLEKAW